MGQWPARPAARPFHRHGWVSLLDYLPGAAMGLGLWLGLRWPWPAIRIVALLAVVVSLALGIVAGLPGNPAQLTQNRGALDWSVIPATVAFLLALGFGRLLAKKGGGGME